MLEGLLILVLVAAMCAAGLALTTTYAARERRRIARESQLADWQLRLLTRAAMKRMLDEARRHQHW